MIRKQNDRRLDETTAERDAGKYDPPKPEPGRRVIEHGQERQGFERPASRSRETGEEPIDDEPGDWEAGDALQAADGGGDDRDAV